MMMMPDHNAGQPPQRLTASELFVSGHGRALVLAVLFVAYIVTAAFSVALNLARLTLPAVVLAEDGAQGQPTLTDLLQLLVALGRLAVFLALAVAFSVWLYRVCKNLPALGNPKSRVEHSPGWAVGSFFVPFANLFVPYRAVREVWQKSDPGVRAEEDFMFAPSSSSSLLPAWWGAWLVSNILSNVAFRLQGRTGSPDAERFAVILDIVSDMVGVLAAALAIQVVRGIDRRQEERSRNVTYVPRTAPPPPLFTQAPRQPQA
jgi:hypothetical protein